MSAAPRVFATAGSAAKCEACLRFGADAAINYREEDFAERVKALTGGKGVNVVLDMVGAPYFARNLRCLAMDGRLVLIAFLGGNRAEDVDLTPVMTRRLTVTGSTMRPRTTAQKGEIARQLRQEVWPILDQGRAGPVIHQVFPLRDAAAAHTLMESEHPHRQDHAGSARLIAAVSLRAAPGGRACGSASPDRRRAPARSSGPPRQWAAWSRSRRIAGATRGRLRAGAAASGPLPPGSIIATRLVGNGDGSSGACGWACGLLVGIDAAATVMCAPSGHSAMTWRW